MKGLGPEESSAYLAILQGLRSSCRFYDTHVHPYEVLFDRFSYDHEATALDVLSLPGKCYTAPLVGRCKFPETVDFEGAAGSQRIRDIWVMLLKKVYGCVGERVFVDQMELSCMDQVLMLPVALETCTGAEFDSRMRWVKQFYAKQEKFSIAGSIPAALPGEEIRLYATTLVERYGIKAIKCHPVVSGIDLGNSGRKEWFEELLAACSHLNLPLIVHSGRNNPYWGGSRANFGWLGHLEEVNLASSGAPVILAHAGCHRCSVQEIEQEALPMLTRMLKRHANLYVDISGIGFEPLKLVLQSVDGDRILFGSDALYATQWEAVTMTMHALKELGKNLEESFVQIASINPEKTIFRYGESHAEVGENQVEPVFGAGEGEVDPGSIAQGDVFLHATESDSGAGVLGFVGPETGDQTQ